LTEPFPERKAKRLNAGLGAENKKACRGRRCGRLFEKMNSDMEGGNRCPRGNPWEEE
jgi:hypothetical protein